MNVDEQIRRALTALDNLPRHPDGRIDYRGARTSLVLVCFVVHDNKLMLLRRSENTANYPGRWSAVSAYIDDATPFVEKVLSVLEQQTGLQAGKVQLFHTGIPHIIDDKELQKTWVIVPARVLLAEEFTPVLQAEEYSAYAWVGKAELASYELVPGFGVSLESVAGDEKPQ
jgi:hypothetical protein